MKKVVELFLVSTLVLTLILVSFGCSASSANTSPLPSSTEVPYKDLVENFVKSDATYAFDGIEGSLKFLKTIGSTSGNETGPIKEWEHTVEYQNRHSGEGDRTGQVLAQEITTHTAIIKVKDGIIVSAVCDTIWNMLSDENLADEVSAQRIAEEFIYDCSTFKFDGIEGSLESVHIEPGWSTVFRSIAVTAEYQTRHSGHGDRTGKVLSPIINNHSAVILVNIDQGTVAMAVCDKTWDMVNDKNPPASVIGTIVNAGNTIPPDGPADVPRIFIYQVQRTDGSIVNVSYTAYPPSPMGDKARAKISLNFHNGSIAIGDTIEALGRLAKETNTIEVIEEGDYTKTYPTEQ